MSFYSSHLFSVYPLRELNQLLKMVGVCDSGGAGKARQWWLANQASWTEHHTANAGAAWKYFDGIGLNMEQMAFDITSPEIAAVIAQDLADAKTLNVTMTPEFFVNGQPLPSFGFKQLKELVDQALADSHAR